VVSAQDWRRCVWAGFWNARMHVLGSPASSQDYEYDGSESLFLRGQSGPLFVAWMGITARLAWSLDGQANIAVFARISRRRAS